MTCQQYRSKGYKELRLWLHNYLLKAGIEVERYSTENLKHLGEVLLLAQAFNKKPIDVASDIYRLKLQYIEQMRLNSLPIGTKEKT